MPWIRLFNGRAAQSKTKREKGGKRARLRVELLEARLTPAAPLLVDATHSLLSQLGAAAPGATLQIEPGATIGATTLSGTLNANVPSGLKTISVSRSFAVGQVITIGGTDTSVVDAVSGSGSNFTLTLHAPTTAAHNVGDAVVPVANTIAIDKAVTIAGDPAMPPSALLKGTTIQYFTQNGAAGAAALRNLSLTAITGNTSGNLTITGDVFNITSGSTAPIGVNSGGALTISSDTFTIGPSASLAFVVIGETSIGAISYASNTISVTGNVGTIGVELVSNFGPISMANDSLTVSGTSSDGGYFAATSGNITVNAAKVSIAGAVSQGMQFQGANCNLSNLTITLGSTAFAALAVSGAGNVVLAGTNSVNVTGAVTTGVSIQAGAAVSVSNLTVKLNNNVAADAMKVISPSSETLSNVSLTVVGNVSADGLDLANNANPAGPISLSNIVVLLEGSASNGLFANAAGNISLAGTESISVTGIVSQNGVNLETTAGDISVANGISVKLGSSAVTGLQLTAATGNITVAGAVQVQVSGAVSNDGIDIATEDLLTVGPITATLSSTAGTGVFLGGATIVGNGPLLVNVTGAVTTVGFVLNASADITVAGSITVHLGSNTPMGLEILSQGNLTVTGAIGVTVAGSVVDYGAELSSHGSNRVTGTLSVSVTGSAGAGLSVVSSTGSVTETVGITVAVGGAITGIVPAAAFVQAATSATLANVNVTASQVASFAGLSAQAVGALTISNVHVTANAGTSSAVGATLSGGSVTASSINVSMTGQASTGLQVSSSVGFTLSNATVLVTGAVGNFGISLFSNGVVNLAGISATLQNTVAGSGIGVSSNGGVNVTGPLSTKITGAVTNTGIAISTGAGNLTISGPISVVLSSTAGTGLSLNSGGALSDTGNITISVAGNLSSDGAQIASFSNATIGGSVNVTLNGTAQTGLEIESLNGSLKNTGTIAVSVAGAVSNGGAAFGAFGGATLTGITVTLGSGSAADGVDMGVGATPQGNWSISNFTEKVTGPVVGIGLSIIGSNANVSTSNLNINLSSSANTGIRIIARGISMTTTVLVVAGNLTQNGISLNASSSVNLTTATVTLKGTTANSVVASGNNGVAVSGLKLQQTGGVTDAVFLISSAGPVSAASSTITLGSTANDGLVTQAGSNTTISGVTLKSTGFVSDDGFNLSGTGNISAANDSITLSNGVADEALSVTSAGGNAVINMDTIVVNTSAIAGIIASAPGSLTLTNTSVTLNTGGGVGAALNSSSGNPQTITGDTFNTSGFGTGLSFNGGAIVALVQGNKFQNNKVGIQIAGDGTSAGIIDLGSGALGSTGGNNFTGFTGVAGNYAISQTNTNATATVFALGNLFSVANHNTVIQDGTHNTNGVGTGVIKA
jgi:fibronectin-binding autotransporter adhesin